MRLKSSKVCTKKNLCVNKSSFQIFHSATLQDFFDGPMYVITSKEWNICTCTHAIHLSISISSCRLENQMNGVQREEGQLAICSSKDRCSIRGCSIYETHAPLFFFSITTRFMDNVKENASRGSSTAEENHRCLRMGLTTQFSLYLQLHLQCSANEPAFHITKQTWHVISSLHLVTHMHKWPAPPYFLQPQINLCHFFWALFY